MRRYAAYGDQRLKLELRPIQKQAIIDLRESWKNHRTHLVTAPCGFGKTALAAHITDGFASKSLRVVFTVPYTALILQTVERFEQYGLKKPAVIWQNHELTDSENPVQIASIDTLIRREFPKCDVLIVDECHLKRVKLLEIIRDSDIPVIGLSATPFPAWLGTYYESLIKTKTTREMIDLGYLSEYEMFGAPKKPDLSKVKTKNYAHGRDYDEKALGEAMEDSVLVGDITSTWLEKGNNEPTIAYCVNVSHANAVTLEFQRVNVSAEVITAKTPQEERQRIFQRFRDGITKIMVSVGTLVAGLDEDVRCIIYARPTKSEVLYVQIIGRGLRLAEGKEKCIILEHSGTWENLGFPCEISIDELKSSSDGMDSTEVDKDEEEKQIKLPKECPACHFLKPAGMHECPKCGFVPLAGEDVETTNDELKVVKRDKKKKVLSMSEKDQFHRELYGYWHQKKLEGKNWSKHWVSNQYKTKIGTWPKGLSDKPLTPSPATLNFIKAQQRAYGKRKRA